MKMSKAGRAWITELEGFSRDVYKDVAGNPTIGVGHLLTQDELSSGKISIGDKSVAYYGGLTWEQVDSLLSQDLYWFENEVAYRVNYRVNNINQNQFDALVSFVFNIGVHAFVKSTLLKKLNAGEYDQVPDQLRRWIYSGGKVVQGLINRREKEIERWNASDSTESTTELSTAEQLQIVADEAERKDLTKAASVIRMTISLGAAFEAQPPQGRGTGQN